MSKERRPLTAIARAFFSLLGAELAPTEACTHRQPQGFMRIGFSRRRHVFLCRSCATTEIEIYDKDTP